MSALQTIVSEVTQSESVKRGVSWLVDHLVPVVEGSLESAQRAEFEELVIDMVAFAFVATEASTREVTHFTDEQTVRLSVSNGLDWALRASAHRVGITFTDNFYDLSVAVEMRKNCAIGFTGGARTVIWERGKLNRTSKSI